MVDDNEFVKRRHLSRGRPRKYDPSSSPQSPQSSTSAGMMAQNPTISNTSSSAVVDETMADATASTTTTLPSAITAVSTTSCNLLFTNHLAAHSMQSSVDIHNQSLYSANSLGSNFQVDDYPDRHKWGVPTAIGSNNRDEMCQASALPEYDSEEE
ncbi:hypothetical protein DMENIID0001_163260 [Sergentomyia squamirostris]